MKQETTNFFNKGLLMDLNPITTPNNVLTNCLNGTFITFDGNEVVLQNDMGNGKVESAKLWPGYIPLGIKEFGGIAYIVSYNPFTGTGQVGSFPSPETDFSGEEYDCSDFNICDTDFFENGVLKKTTIKGYLNDNEIVKLGDLFEVCILDDSLSNGDKPLTELYSNILTIVSNLKELNSTISTSDTRKINSGKKILNIKLATIDDNNNITYLNLDDEEYKVNSDVLAKFFMPINTEIADLQSYNAYTHSRNGKLMVVAELESVDSFELTITPEERIDNSPYVYTFKAKVKPYDFWRWLEIKIDYREDGVEQDSITRYIKNIYYDDFNNGVINTSALVKPGITNPLFPNVNLTMSNSTNIVDYNNEMTEDDYVSWTLSTLKKDTILNYTITPHTTYNKVEKLTKSGTLNVNRFLDNFVELTRWKYKTVVDDNNVPWLNIDWGIECNTIGDNKLYRIDFKFFEVVDNNPVIVTLYAGSTDNQQNSIYEQFLTTNYTSRFELGNTLEKNKLYLCTIQYYTTDTSVANFNPITLTSSNWNLWTEENRFVYTNNLMDQYYDDTTYQDFNTINPLNTLVTKAVITTQTISSTETYTNPTFLSYSSEGSFYSQGVKSTQSNIIVTLTHDIDIEGLAYNLDDSNISLNVNPIVDPKIQDLAIIGNFDTVYPNVNSSLVKQNLTDVYVDDLYNPNVTLSLLELRPITTLGSSTTIDLNFRSLTTKSKKFKMNVVAKSEFKADKVENQSTTPINANVLSKYFTTENYTKIFGYNINEVNGIPYFNRAYTHSLTYFTDSSWLAGANYVLPILTNETYDHKSYIKLNTTNRVGEILSQQYTDINSILNLNDSESNYNNNLPAVSFFASKSLVNASQNLTKAPDYLAWNNTFLTIDWCFPMLKTTENKYIDIYAQEDNLINVSKKPLRHTPRVLYEAMLDMFDDKWLFQITNINSSLYKASSTQNKYNSYNVSNTVNAYTSGNVVVNNYTLNSTQLNTSNVNDCFINNNYLLSGDVNFNNVNLLTEYIYHNSNKSILISSASFDNTMLNLTDSGILSNVNNSLFYIKDGELIDLTNLTDSSNNIYNEANYYTSKIVQNELTFHKGVGIWTTVDNADRSFKELRIKIPTSLTRVPNVLSSGKISHDYKGKNKNTMWESVKDSKRSSYIAGTANDVPYQKLQSAPFFRSIYFKPFNWD